MSNDDPVTIAAPVEELAPVKAAQGTYKITTPDGKQFEFAGLATAPDGGITLPSLIDMILVTLASLDNPTVDQILQANDVVQKDVNGKLYYPRPKFVGETPQEINL